MPTPPIPQTFLPLRPSARPFLAAASIALAGLAFPAVTNGRQANPPATPATKQPAPAPTNPAPTNPPAAAPAPAATKPVEPAADAQKQPTPRELLEDFIHYTLIDRADLARSMGESLIARNLPGSEFVHLVDSSQGGYRRFTQAIIRAQKRSDLEPVGSKLLNSYEGGKLGAARNPESIAESIKLLIGDSSRERVYARSRLIGAGEYAMPQLTAALLDATNSRLQAAVRQVIVELGRQAIMPLAAVLPHLSEPQQEQVLKILGDIPYPASGPFIYDILLTTKNPAVRTAAQDAARRVTGGVNPQFSVADRYVDLANEFYAASPSLISFPNDPNQPVWLYLAGSAGAGLTFQSVDSRIFPAMMAMRLSESALERDATNIRAVSTWLAGNFQRELRSPTGYDNPLYAKTRREAMYYAVAAGPAPAQDVLARALTTTDAPLARKALAAIERTAGGRTLWTASGPQGRTPILDALRFPSRRVQLDAALALGAAGPREPFAGSDQVVRILGSAIRDVGARYVAVLSGDTERQASISDLFRSQGYTPLPPAVRLDDIAQAIVDAPGIDLIVTDLPAQSTQDLIERARVDTKLRATPILALASAQGATELSQRFGRDRLVRVGRQGLSAKEISTSAQQLVESAAGGEIKAEDALAYKVRALAVLRDLGVSANGVMNIADAQAALVATLTDAKTPPDIRLKTADVLVFIPTPAAQTALADVSLGATGEDRVRLLSRLGESARRNGNHLDNAGVTKLLDLTRTGKGDEATAAAAIVGALNLPNARLAPLILGKAE